MEKMTTATVWSTTSPARRRDLSASVIQVIQRPFAKDPANRGFRPARQASGGPVWGKSHPNPKNAMPKMMIVTA